MTGMTGGRACGRARYEEYEPLKQRWVAASGQLPG